MRARLRNKYDDKYSITVQLPKKPLELYEILDRLGVENKYCNVYINIDDERIPEEMCKGGFYDDLFKLNFLAQRLEQLTPSYTAGFKAVLMAHEDYNLDDLILVTYGLETYPIYPCRDYAELGEVVIDNDMISEVENCPDELIPLLDKAAIGRLAAEQFKGTFVDGYYCEVFDYEPPDMEINIGKPSRNEFQILIGETEKSVQWYTLPYNGDYTEEQVYELRSPLPYIDHVENISKLNELAEKIAALDNADLVKLKAVMELGEIENEEGAIEVIDSLSEFEFAPLLRDENSYGKKYLQKLLPQDFDIEILEAANLADIGSRVLNAKGGIVTSYGIISGQGQELYSPIFREQEQTEDEEMEVSLT
ncbi:hypothetical protein [uncultured Ruminococcus sp.]|uniref:hypothetical protein n=1 Tax=uncultured Ruminococcus sp. TaxID=165186 RepID=UPI00263351F7|nr:hypothetical protein [uncultured Ruminococcus sp.]